MAEVNVARAVVGGLDTVFVGNPGNAPDSTGRGAVPYPYEIGRTEVTVTQYAIFLNAVADADPNSLYHVNMGFEGSISRSGPSGSYHYAVVGNFNEPINNVNWFDAARYCNWLHNGQPIGPQNAFTTEGGAYTLAGINTGIVNKNAGAKMWIPSDDEWYKAAYHQPAAQGGDADHYWLYPTRSNTQPNSRNGSASDPNSANYYYDDGIANGFNGGYAINNSTTAPFDGRTPATAFALAASFYGTFDQGGNLMEWTDFFSGGGREITGGSWLDGEVVMRAVNYFNVSLPEQHYGNVGFRFAAGVPEPSAVLALLALPALVARRSRRGGSRVACGKGDKYIYIKIMDLSPFPHPHRPPPLAPPG